MKETPDTVACIIYQDPQSARDAYTKLYYSDLPHPTKVSVHQGEISQDQFTIAQSRSRLGALVGALVVGILTAAFLGFASSAGVLENLQTSTAIIAGLLGGGALGVLTGALAGATMPPRFLSRARQAVRDGGVALVARFQSIEQARRARRFLVSRPGAVTSLA
ncbi:MAG: hypothetical protein AAGF11_26640 [Myxococcota bacterium]